MEAIIMLGIIGTGYILNDSKENNDTIDGELTPELQLPTHNNVYDTNNYDESKGIQLTTANELLNNNKNVYNITNVDIGVDRLMGLSDTVISKSTKLEKEYYTMLVNAFQFTMKMNDLSNYNNLSENIWFIKADPFKHNPNFIHFFKERIIYFKGCKCRLI